MEPLPLIILIIFSNGLVASIGVVKRVGVGQAELDALRKSIESVPSSKRIEWLTEHVLAGLKWKIVNKFLDVERVVYCRHVILDLLTMELPSYECSYFATVIDDGHVLDRLEIERNTWDEDNGVGVGDSLHPWESAGVRHVRYDMADGGSQCRAYKHVTVPAGWEWQGQEEPCPPSGTVIDSRGGAANSNPKTNPPDKMEGNPTGPTNTIANGETKADADAKGKSNTIPNQSGTTVDTNGTQEKKINGANISTTSAATAVGASDPKITSR